MKYNKLIVIALLFSSQLYGQFWKQDYNLRNLTLNHADSSVVFHAIAEDAPVKLDNSLDYYWYKSGKIKSNKGGYDGFLLHGEYKMFDAKGNLILEGDFNKGLKSGEWKKWDNFGNLVETSQWKNGKLHGKKTVYEGSNFEEKRYKNGEQIVVQEDVVSDEPIPEKQEEKKKPKKKKEKKNRKEELEELEEDTSLGK